MTRAPTNTLMKSAWSRTDIAFLFLVNSLPIVDITRNFIMVQMTRIGMTTRFAINELVYSMH